MIALRNRFWAMIIAAISLVAMIPSGCSREAGSEGEKRVVKRERPEKEEGVVTLSREKQKEFGLKIGKVLSQEISIPISATAVIELNADRVSKISPRTWGRIVKVEAFQGDRIQENQALAYFDSPEIDLTWTEYLKARSKLELAERNFKREEILFEKKVSPEKDVLKARQELKEAEANLILARGKFRILDIDVPQFEVKRSNGEHPLIPLSSPINGTVIEKSVSQGEVVGPDKVLFTVADLSSLWVVIDIFEKDIALVEPGMSVKLTVSAFPEKVFKGKISYAGDVIDEKSRTAKARVTVENSSGLLKPGMFATVSIESAAGSVEKQVTIPQESVILEGSRRYVFIPTGPESFKKREISVGRTAGKWVVVTGGLKEGDTVVTAGSFILKSELKKEELAGD